MTKERRIFCVISLGMARKILLSLVMFEDFLPKTLFIQKKVVPLWQQFPPRLLTMRTTVGLRFLYKVKILNDGNIYK